MLASAIACGRTEIEPPVPSPASCDSVLWVSHFGGDCAQNLSAFVLDHRDRLVLAGHFCGTIDFGGGPLTPQGPNRSAFVTVLEPDGSHRWSRSAGADASALAVAADSENNVLLAGHFEGAFDFGTGPQEAASGVFVAKFDAEGQPLWSRVIEATFPPEIGGIAADASDDIIVASASFVAKFDAEGRELWVKRYEGSASPKGVATDAASNIFLLGLLHRGALTFEDGSVQSPPRTGSAYVLKLDAAGGYLWSAAVAGASAGGLDNDSRGNTYTGFSSFGKTTLEESAPEKARISIASFSGDGVVRWVEPVLGNAHVLSLDIAPRGQVIAAGLFSSRLEIDDVAIETQAFHTGFTLGLTREGELSWYFIPPARSVIDTNRVVAARAASDDTVFLAGQFTANLLPGTKTQRAGEDEVFVAKLRCP